MNAEKQYLEIAKNILTNGYDTQDRTGTGCRFVSGATLRHDYSEGFPLLTTKKVWFKGVLVELLWFVSGDTNVKYLRSNGVKIWDPWADENGDLGAIYGKQLRDFAGVDQLQNTIDSIVQDPTSRRHVMTLWNPADLSNQNLSCCHGTAIQFIAQDRYLDLVTFQRSADWFLGVPWNIASYSVLLFMVSHLTDRTPRELVYNFGHAHIYSNHFSQMKIQAEREPFSLPSLRVLGQVESINDFAISDFSLEGYKHHPHLKGEISI